MVWYVCFLHIITLAYKLFRHRDALNHSLTFVATKSTFCVVVNVFPPSGLFTHHSFLLLQSTCLYLHTYTYIRTLTLFPSLVVFICSRVAVVLPLVQFVLQPAVVDCCRCGCCCYYYFVDLDLVHDLLFV